MTVSVSDIDRTTVVSLIHVGIVMGLFINNAQDPGLMCMISSSAAILTSKLSRNFSSCIKYCSSLSPPHMSILVILGEDCARIYSPVQTPISPASLVEMGRFE